MAQKYDVIIIGGGPNGLTAGAYLSKAGLKILVVDKKCEMGGGCATEELCHYQALNNTHAIYMMMVDYAPAYKDLELEEKYELKHVYPSMQWAMPLADGRCLCLYSDVEKSCQSIAKFSKKDADSYREIYHYATRLTEDFLGPATYLPPTPALDEAAKLDKTDWGKRMLGYSAQSPREIIEGLFEDEHVRCLMLYLVCMWGLDPEVSGIGYLPLLYINRSVNYRLAVTGSHKLPSALIKVILENKGVLMGSARIKRIIMKDNTATGLELEDGTILEADKAVLSTIDPHQTFFDYVGKEKLSKDFVWKLEGWRWEWESLCTAHLALTEPPDFTAAKADPEINKSLAYLLGYETEEALLKDFEGVKRGELHEPPAFNCCFPTVHDPSQIEPLMIYSDVKHTAYISQFAPYELKEGGVDRWYSMSFKEEIARRNLEMLRKYAPNLTDDKILGTFVNTPLDVENKFSDMVKGGIKQGEYNPLQMGFNRPNDECCNHRTPIKNLYIGGASVHSGGTVLLGSGYLAANAIAEDFGVKKWWKEAECVARARAKGTI